MENKHLKIDSTDIFLEDGPRVGQGKITVSDGYKGAYTSAWGAMGGTIYDFMDRINGDYFADNLLGTRAMTEFDGKGSVRNIRKHIRNEFAYELPWYNFMSAQKEMREELKRLESCGGQEIFVDHCNRFVDGLMCSDLDYRDENEFKDIIRNIFECEPWNFIELKLSKEFIWLRNLHKKLKKKLS